MDYIIKNEKLKLIYESGKGAWTYHLRIPNSEHIEGKWGEIKVSGSIDDYKLESRNLAPTKEGDKILSINNEIRTAINKEGGDTVNVSLYLISKKEEITEKEILDTFKESNVLDVFKKLSVLEKKEILDNIISQKMEEKQITIIIKYIDHLSKTV
ncbi:DUF1905 domain-containing protein [Chryseobacterium formosus]|uniref:DUF1905 domain-containing protein n=1 Tax=Chryseobacterium formosus TaxID=1537363 RepID=A0ABT3XV98_9FLAO|nr:DUF1905 domain-containing protein [Chryseobacterium formosus]MCX8525555.1 DUF1905 domain-containing protein [Chryseobacterium formosus]